MRRMALPAALAAVGLLAGRLGSRKWAFRRPAKVSPAAGVIDMHVHSHPDVFGRDLADIEVAHRRQPQGHARHRAEEPCRHHRRPRALAMNAVPGIDVFGGIVLNNANGGINPAAVEWMHRM